MDDARLSRFEDRLDRLEQRLLALESTMAPPATGRTLVGDIPPEPAAAAEPPVSESGAGSSRSSVVSLLGRFLIILGGAFLLRAATEAGTIPPAVGVTLGLLYGIAQLWLASRAAGRGDNDSANWFGFGGAFILLPLIVESTLDFGILSPSIAAVLLPVLGFSGVVIAFHYHLRPMAWAFLAGTGSVGLYLAMKTGLGLEFPMGVIVVGIAGLWMGYLRHWYGLAIVGSVVPVALVTVVTLLMILDFDAGVTTSLTPGVALVLQLMLVAGFLGSFLARSLRWSAPVGLPEMMQSVMAMFVGIVGGVLSATRDPSLNGPFGIAMLVTGLICYVVSFARIDRREGHRQNFAFFSTVALVTTLTGTSRILDGPLELGLFILAALTLAWFGAKRKRATLSLHAALYVVAAGFASGLVGCSLDAMVGEGCVLPAGAELARMLLVVAVGIVCLGAPVATEGKTWGRLSRLSKYVYLTFLGTANCGMIVMFLTSRFATMPDGEFDAGMVAAFRTGSLAVLAILLAYVSRWQKLREGARLVPAVLVFGAMSLGLGDLRQGRAATQFASMALFGIALILAPRMARRARSAEPAPPEAVPGS